jgi:hypothetical protein
MLTLVVGQHHLMTTWWQWILAILWLLALLGSAIYILQLPHMRATYTGVRNTSKTIVDFMEKELDDPYPYPRYLRFLRFPKLMRRSLAWLGFLSIVWLVVVGW